MSQKDILTLITIMTTQTNDYQRKIMPKYQVYVTGTVDDDFEITANDPTEAFKTAEELFRKKYLEVDPWGDVSAGSYEVVGGEDEAERNDGY